MYVNLNSKDTLIKELTGTYGDVLTPCMLPFILLKAIKINTYKVSIRKLEKFPNGDFVLRIE